jgi:Protein of unknown function (DUF3800)
MRIAYLDESGTPEPGGNTSHFVLLALVIEDKSWKKKDADILAVKKKYGLAGAELHAAWMNRRYAEQESIPDFEKLSTENRRLAMKKARDAALIKRAAVHGITKMKLLKKNFMKTDAYVHVTLPERKAFLKEVSETVNGWTDACILADCIDKTIFKGAPKTPPLDEAFEQVVSRFHRYLEDEAPGELGILVEDNNDEVALRLTETMRRFHDEGTKWKKIPQLIETPLFVDSKLTSLVQVADLCAYALRRYLENGETDLFDPIFARGRRDGKRCVGIRHYRGSKPCPCRICKEH